MIRGIYVNSVKIVLTIAAAALDADQMNATTVAGVTNMLHMKIHMDTDPIIGFQFTSLDIHNTCDSL